jgi:hypothetical protein
VQSAQRRSYRNAADLDLAKPIAADFPAIRLEVSMIVQPRDDDPLRFAAGRGRDLRLRGRSDGDFDAFIRRRLLAQHARQISQSLEVLLRDRRD